MGVSKDMKKKPKMTKLVESRKLLKKDLIAKISAQTQISKIICAKILEDMIEIISQDLENGNSVKITGLGTFIIRQKQSRMGRNPKTGKNAIVIGRRVVLFRAGTYIRQKLKLKSEPQLVRKLDNK